MLPFTICLNVSISQNYSSSPSYITESADNFTINRNLIITGISWYGQYLGSVSTPEIGDGFVSRAQNFTTGSWKNYPSYSTGNLSLQLFTRESSPIRSNAVKILLNMKQIESEQHNNR